MQKHILREKQTVARGGFLQRLKNALLQNCYPALRGRQYSQYRDRVNKKSSTRWVNCIKQHNAYGTNVARLRCASHVIGFATFIPTNKAKLEFGHFFCG